MFLYVRQVMNTYYVHVAIRYDMYVHYIHIHKSFCLHACYSLYTNYTYSMVQCKKVNEIFVICSRMFAIGITSRRFSETRVQEFCVVLIRQLRLKCEY